MKKLFLLFIIVNVAHAAAAQDEPGLEKTISWLDEKIDGYSRYVVVDSVGLLSEVSFSLEPFDSNLCRIKLAENAKGIGSVSYEFNFSELDPEKVELRQITDVYPSIKIHDDVYLINLQTNSGAKIIYCEYKGAYGGDTFEDSFNIGVKTQEMGERLVKAIRHSIKLCSKEDDLFK